MGHPLRQAVFDRVLIDLNTQCDFLLSKGAAPVANRVAVLPNVRRVMNWARLERIPVISTIDAHRPGEPSNGLPPFCVDRTLGQRKLPFTLLPRRIVLTGDNTTDIPFEPFRRYQQVIFSKRRTDFLSNPKADRLINEIQTSHLLILGVITESCVKVAALALMARQRRVGVIVDACGHWSAADAELAFLQMKAKGAVLLTTDELLSGAADDLLRAPFGAISDDDEASSADNGSPAVDRMKLAGAVSPEFESTDAPQEAGKGNGRGNGRSGSTEPPAPHRMTTARHAPGNGNGRGRSLRKAAGISSTRSSRETRKSGRRTR